ncbi:hypothetical protein CHARACLAT_032003 [Characodon lateralis]|uniref:Myb-like domain-containing protein n=1 Tax=Characodon lateralis TaxID=208331 RepID=A0ABU7D2E3_9TELE|nr:hypothetical protein [Characodon lateralis]
MFTTKYRKKRWRKTKWTEEQSLLLAQLVEENRGEWKAPAWNVSSTGSCFIQNLERRLQHTSEPLHRQVCAVDDI